MEGCEGVSLNDFYTSIIAGDDEVTTTACRGDVRMGPYSYKNDTNWATYPVEQVPIEGTYGAVRERFTCPSCSSSANTGA